jgi:homoserine O-acetyltransferase
MTKAMDYFDVPECYDAGDLSTALASICSRILVLSYSSDWLFPPYQSQEIVDALLRNEKDVTYVNIDTPCGHDAFLLELESQGAIISAFLAATADGTRQAQAEARR